MNWLRCALSVKGILELKEEGKLFTKHVPLKNVM